VAAVVVLQQETQTQGQTQLHVLAQQEPMVAETAETVELETQTASLVLLQVAVAVEQDEITRLPEQEEVD
jgi:hypothetical protein